MGCNPPHMSHQSVRETSAQSPAPDCGVAQGWTLRACPPTRPAQMSGFVQVTPESFNPPKLPIDTMTSANHGGCVRVETTPALRWPAKSEATSPALLPAERKPVDGQPFDSDPRQRDQDRRRRRTTRAARSLPARAGWPDWNAHRLRHVAM